MFWNHLRVGTRLFSGFAVVLGLLVGLAGLAAYLLVRAEADLERVMAMERRAALAREWAGATTLNASRVLAIGRAENRDEMADYFKPSIAQTTQRINELQKTLESMVDDEQGKTQLAEVAVRRKKYIEARNRWQEMLKSGDKGGAEAFLSSDLMPSIQAYVAAQEVMGRVEMEKRDGVLTEASAAAQVWWSLFIIAALTAGAIVVGSGTAWGIARSIGRPVRQAVEIAKSISQGNLTQNIVTGRLDEFGELLFALKNMQSALVTVVGEIRQASESIGGASSEIASGNLDLSSRTEQAASSLEETASSMEQLTATVRQSAQAAREASELAANATAVALRGGEVVERVVHTMHDIEASSQRIGDIIGVIDGIAFQTNILALNAAVEAARAGEQGRGFAVVAGEVRSLAQRSAEAAKEIKALIETSASKVEGGTTLVREAGTTMQEIVDGVQRVNAIVGNISLAASEQSEGLAQVNVAVNQLDQMTQQNAALVEQSAAAAESLKHQASHLTQVVGGFRLTDMREPQLRLTA